MRVKLIKDHDDYHLVNDEQFIIGTTDESILSCTDKYKLSLKNCQAIANGYDLDELAKEELLKAEKHHKLLSPITYRDGVIKGFRKALEVNSDKRFTFKEMVDCWNKALNFQEHKETLGEHIQSLQQTEWDVEIVMRPASLVYKSNLVIEELDADGCLILKRIKE